jgi:hypothetical protein
MTISEMQETVDTLKAGKLRQPKMWTDLVWQVVHHFDLDRQKGQPAVELEKRWVECIAIARCLKPISMKEWSTGRTLDWIDKAVG